MEPFHKILLSGSDVRCGTSGELNEASLATEQTALASRRGSAAIVLTSGRLHRWSQSGHYSLPVRAFTWLTPSQMLCWLLGRSVGRSIGRSLARLLGVRRPVKRRSKRRLASLSECIVPIFENQKPDIGNMQTTNRYASSGGGSGGGGDG